MSSRDKQNEVKTQLDVGSADIIRLIQAHLTEAGLHEACRALQKESGILMAASTIPSSQWYKMAISGDWSGILQALSVLDHDRLESELIANVYEMAVLELADLDEFELAYSTFRLVHSKLDVENPTKNKQQSNQPDLTRTRLLEQQLAALAAKRANDPSTPVPADFYGTMTKNQRRQKLAAWLEETIPQQPKRRLTTLIQQAIKWQTYTGQLPYVKEMWDDDIERNEDLGKRKRRKKVFDLVVGESSVSKSYNKEDESHYQKEDIPDNPYAVVKFGKRARPKSAIFLPDGSGLVTGSSDGLIEIWDPASRFQELRLDLPYQKAEELLGHDDGASITALTMSNDGTLLGSGDSNGFVRVWKVDSGLCLRSIQASSSALGSLCFSPDASHVLVASHDGVCREFGLLTSKVLKEFRGHTSYLTCAFYHLQEDLSQLRVLTGSGDGTMRIWNGKTAELLATFRPISMGHQSLLSASGSSIVVHSDVDDSTASGSPTMHSVIPLHTPPNSIVLVPRGIRAFLVSTSGVVLRVFEMPQQASGEPPVFVAASVSCTNQCLFTVTDSGTCHVFNIMTGSLERSIRNFAEESTTSLEKTVEITSIFAHPQKAVLGAFSDDQTQKKGQLVLWR